MGVNHSITTKPKINTKDALVTLGKYHKLFTDKVDVTSNGESIVVKLVKDEQS